MWNRESIIVHIKEKNMFIQGLSRNINKCFKDRHQYISPALYNSKTMKNTTVN